MSTTSRGELWSAYLGNLFEHYDTALFGFLSPFLAPLFFPGHEPMTALILTYAIIPLGMLARPVGSLVFGYIGDIYGRSHTLFLTLAGMGLVSGCIAFSPSYTQVGILAPILFFLGRALQNFLAAGESMGGAIFLLESSPENRHDMLSGLFSASSIAGHLLASLGVYLLCHFNAIDPGWRLLYLCGCITAYFGCKFRKPSCSLKSSVRLSETIANFKIVFWTHKKPLLLITLCSGFAYANYSMALILMNGVIPLISSLSKTEVMKINTYMLVLDCCALPFFGWLAFKIQRETIMLLASLGVVLFSIPLFLSLEMASLTGIIGIRVALVIFGVAFFAPFHAWAQQLVPKECRYVIISMGYALGSQLLGSPAAALSLWCFQNTGMISSIAWYWILLGCASFLAILKTLPAKKTFQVRAS